MKSYSGTWVDGPKLANEVVGGSEGLRRLRELIEEGYPIDARPHPDKRRDIWQYRYRVDQPVSPLRQDPEGYEYTPATPPLKVENTEVVDGFLTQTSYKFDKLPTKVVFGSVAVCPRCHGKTRKYVFKNYDELRHKDPTKEGRPCINCNGWGIVQNVGPVGITMPDGMS